MAEKLKITLVKSTIGAIPKHKKTVEALGLKKLNNFSRQRQALRQQAAHRLWRLIRQAP